MFACSLRADKRFIYLASLLMVVCGATPGLGENLPEVSARPPWTLLSQSDDAKSGYVLHRRPTAASPAGPSLLAGQTRQRANGQLHHIDDKGEGIECDLPGHGQL